MAERIKFVILGGSSIAKGRPPRSQHAARGALHRGQPRLAHPFRRITERRMDHEPLGALVQQ